MSKGLGLLLVTLTLLLSACSSASEESSSEPVEITVEPSAEPSVQNESKKSNSSPTPSSKAKSDAKPAATAKAEEPGYYLTFQEYEKSKDRFQNSDVVLFFNANWCSTCKIARDNIESNLESIPANLAIVVVDFDSETDLRKKYGVTIQHTFIQIDKDGNELAKWAGSVTAEEIAEKTV